ncbi:MAG: acyl-CoA thioesterase [Bacteroidaceae bacterium]|jgi:acyl-CoA thioester hydrolase|nr:acyl-CoA thioesterase [Bacteroidaceae bacterium]MBQ5740295.1 acyl-CoA thioesterase [Bacteroidaceae bacterium]
MKYVHELKLKVRDYECDLQGIVNNANYQHYLEHARHEFLLQAGISFAQLHQEGTDAVVARLNMQFKTPLTSQDEYVCRLNIKKDGIKYVFLQDIFRLPDEKLCVRAQVDTVCITNGKLQTTTPLDHLLEPYFMKEE